jgi:hypothetical protein
MWCGSVVVSKHDAGRAHPRGATGGPKETFFGEFRAEPPHQGLPAGIGLERIEQESQANSKVRHIGSRQSDAPVVLTFYHSRRILV